MPARRSAAAIGAAVALAAGALALAPSAQAATASGSGGGQATATVLRTSLDVSLVNKTVNVPLNVVLNDVHAPADAHETALSAQLAGVDNGRPFSVLSADVATARATADQHQAQGYVNIVNAKVHLPGLPLLSLIEAHEVTARATCEAGRQPTAYADLLGDVVVLGKKINVTTAGTTKVDVPGVGEVRLDLSKTETTSHTAAATALDLHVSVNPLKLGVADVEGDVTLARATCETPQGGGSSTGGSTSGGSTSGGSTTGGSTGGGSTSGGGSTGGGTQGTGSSGGSGGSAGSSTGTQTAGTGKNLAETGASSSTPYIATGAGALLVTGAAVVFVTRRRRSSSGQS
ncbi:SCO1860 family LAETG-anchored protein [Streptomyces humicola]